MELLYIVRNNERDNHSILGVYTSAKAAKKAIEYNEKRLLENGYHKHGTFKAREVREAEKRGELIKFIPYKEVKIVPTNGLNYHGCSAYPIELLLEDPEEFEIKVKEWFMDVPPTWSETTDDLD